MSPLTFWGFNHYESQFSLNCLFPSFSHTSIKKTKALSLHRSSSSPFLKRDTSAIPHSDTESPTKFFLSCKLFNLFFFEDFIFLPFFSMKTRRPRPLTMVKMGQLRQFCASPEAMATFKQHYDVSTHVHLRLVPVNDMRKGSNDQILRISIMSIVEGRLCFPLHPLFCQTLNTRNLAPPSNALSTYSR